MATSKDQGPVLLIGGGRMGFALLRGWIEAGIAPSGIAVIEPAPSAELLESSASLGFALNGPLVTAPGGTIVLAVKPQKASEIFDGISAIATNDMLIISVMAGKTIASLRRLCPRVRAVVRAMPNLPAQVGRGMTAAFADPGCSGNQLQLAHQLLASSGKLEWLKSEALLDAATGLSGSGPAYLFYIADCFARAGVAAGLPDDIAERLARETLSGAGELLRLSSKTAAQLRADVTSPAGTTEAGLRVLMRDNVLQNLLTGTVEAAARRARELAG